MKIEMEMYCNGEPVTMDSVLAELATLREQVKVLREALGWLDNEMDCRDADFGGCLFTRQDFEIVRNVLKQTKPKDGE